MTASWCGSDGNVVSIRIMNVELLLEEVEPTTDEGRWYRVLVDGAHGHVACIKIGRTTVCHLETQTQLGSLVRDGLMDF